MNEHDPTASPRRDDPTPIDPSLPDAAHPATPVPDAQRHRTRRVVAAVGVGAVGLAAGGILAGTLSSSASAEDRASGAYGSTGYAGDRGPGGPGGAGGHGPRGDEKPLTGTTKAKVLAAVKAKYPSATVQRLETDSDGVYEAHVLLDGKPTIVQVGKDFTVTGAQTMPTRDGRGGPGGGDHDGDGPGGTSEGGTPSAPSSPAA